MTAKEKANRLVSLFEEQQEYYDANQCSRIAKQCALIAVDEILAALTDYGEENDELQNMESDFRFYEKVKSEIEKL